MVPPANITPAMTDARTTDGSHRVATMNTASPRMPNSALTLGWIASGAPGGYDLANGLATNGYGEHSPHGYSMQAGFAAEVVLTLIFLFVILGATDRRAPAGRTRVSDPRAA